MPYKKDKKVSKINKPKTRQIKSKNVKKYKSGFIDTRGINPLLNNTKNYFDRTGTNLQTAFTNSIRDPRQIMKEGQQFMTRQDKINNSTNKSFQKSFDSAGKEISSYVKIKVDNTKRQIVNAPGNILHGTTKYLTKDLPTILSRHIPACGHSGCKGIYDRGKKNKSKSK